MLITEIALPIVAILCAIFIKVENYSIDAKLATIVAGIIGQIVLVGIQSKQISISINDNKEKINNVEKSICFTNEMATILSSGEERRIQYIRRRLNELEEMFKVVAHEQESKLLSVTTYYSELQNLKKQLDNDPKKSRCEIWAMTAFSDNEWDDTDNDLEKYWCDDLLKLANTIVTKRICIINQKLLPLLTKNEEYYNLQEQDWQRHKNSEEKIAEKSLKSFMDYLRTYYSDLGKQYKVTNYALKSDSQQYYDLVEAKGFFGIMLSNHETYVIKGEAVNAHTGLQGQYVFDRNVIETLYSLHKTACSNLPELSKFIKSNSSEAFLSFCKNKGINFK